jgi:hypothetical protein
MIDAKASYCPSHAGAISHLMLIPLSVT